MKFHLANSSRSIEFSQATREFAIENKFELKGQIFTADREQLRAPRVVRIGIIQNKIVLPTTAPLAEQRNAIHRRVETLINGAALSGVNIICLQEAWSKQNCK